MRALITGKPLNIAKAADVPLAVDLFRYMAGWATRLRATPFPCPGRKPPGKISGVHAEGADRRCRPDHSMEFPLLMAAWKLGPALATGCTVVLKPAEQTPLTALRPRRTDSRGRNPGRRRQHRSGLRRDCRRGLAAHPDVDKVAFTGSTEVGKLIVHAAAGNLKKVRWSWAASLRTSFSKMPISKRRFPEPPAPSSSITASAAARAHGCTSKSGFSTG